MQTRIVRIGNSKGLRIPAHILRQCEIEDLINLEIIDGKIIISSAEKPRQGWDEQFRLMHKNGDDKLLIDDSLEAGEEDDRTW
ncbi:MAG: hypothetical protein CVV03_09935 [Firmicutes bacterium HGW-Firmicutes-8]|nr:MAG: hypothetical protein CVV03_09935 [Firmicutes bacterium HGW-Firmicutes-8]